MNLNSFDTSAEARRIQAAAHAHLGAEGRFRAALELSELARAVRLAGLRAEDPRSSDSELIRVFIAETHGVHLEPVD